MCMCMCMCDACVCVMSVYRMCMCDACVCVMSVYVCPLFKGESAASESLFKKCILGIFGVLAVACR